MLIHFTTGSTYKRGNRVDRGRWRLSSVASALLVANENFGSDAINLRKFATRMTTFKSVGWEYLENIGTSRCKTLPYFSTSAIILWLNLYISIFRCQTFLIPHPITIIRPCPPNCQTFLIPSVLSLCSGVHVLLLMLCCNIGSDGNFCDMFVTPTICSELT
jgi:hypothetical protein